MKELKPKLSAMLSGVAGEYYVAAELSKRGYIASITLRNTKGVDILCSNSDASKSVGIQVKTNRSSNRSWMLNQKVENYFAENLFFVFVNLNDNLAPPDYFIVESKIVATHARETHQTWLDTPGLSGQPHKDTLVRKFSDIEERYKENWNILGLN